MRNNTEAVHGNTKLPGCLIDNAHWGSDEKAGTYAPQKPRRIFCRETYEI